MKWEPKNPARVFEVGIDEKIELKDCGQMKLEANEQITFVTKSGAELDVVQKEWGFYATPSLNGRLKEFGLRAVLVKSPGGKYYIWLVEKEKEAAFQKYLKLEQHEIVTWLDSDEALKKLEQSTK
jgi:hypothetical protein